MRVAVVVLFLFGVVIGLATFIENDYGTQTARALIYSAQWFEFFLLFFILVLLYNIVRYKSYKKAKLSVFVFHIAFLVIGIGAAITRYIGYEGVMHIREGASSSTMVSDVKVLQIDARKGEQQASFESSYFFSSLTKESASNLFYNIVRIVFPENRINERLQVGDQSVNVELLQYYPSAVQQYVPDPENGKKVIALKISSGMKGQDVYLSKGETYTADNLVVSFDKSESYAEGKTYFSITDRDGQLQVQTDFDLQTLSMDTQEEANLTKGLNTLEKRKLYRFDGNMLVLKDVYEKASKSYSSSSLKTELGKPELATFKVTVGDQSQEVNLLAYSGRVGEPEIVTLNGVEVMLSLGAKVIDLPFSLKLLDFQLERYPGSNSPSSYASEVELTDKEQGIESMPFRIYMNHVLDHRNYRFFQSSFDTDEQGTILSVNHDPGTLPTYIGYLLLTIGMIWNIFARNGRLQQLWRGAKKLQETAIMVAVAFLIFGTTTTVQAAGLEVDEPTQQQIDSYDSAIVERFGRLVVQSHGGRMKPIDTLAHEVVSKLSGKSAIYGVEPAEIFLGMTVDPKFYQTLPMIKITHPQIALDIGLDEDTKYAKFTDFFENQTHEYKLINQVNEASRKKPLEKSKYDKELVNVDERVNVAYMVYSGTLFQIYPVPGDTNNKWMNPQEAIEKLPKEMADMTRVMTVHLFQGLAYGSEDNNWSKADQAIHLVELYQNKFGSEVLPSPTHIEMEIRYNQLGLFAKLVPLYLLVGILLLIFAFINVIKPRFSLTWVMRIAWIVTIIGFVLHIIGLGMRWYIAGHAPWSNSYESIVFIAASTVMAGLFFARKSPFTLAATTILAGITMGVAHMNFINPEITNLVPVLKSYWLMIHVATIISGDGFLGLGSILSLLVLILFIIRGKGEDNIDRSIKELTKIAEMSLIVGLFLMTVGNFLGGIWANESWGRYWGWDSKETWAAVTILIYASVLHLRFIPKFNNPFVFNVASTWAYSTVLMTYFGVNYYLSGLHSYAAGEPVPIPVWVYYGVAGLFAVTVLAAFNRRLK